MKETLYGILDCNFEPFLPCVFPHLNFNGKELEITENTLLDFTSKRFKVRNKKGFEILLPYLYSSCDSEFIPNTDETLIFAYKYSKNGRLCEGIINKNGKVIIQANYQYINKLTNSLYEAAIYDCDYKYGSDTKITLFYIHQNNKAEKLNSYLHIEGPTPISYCEYFKVRVYSNINKTNVKVGIVNNCGVEIIPPIYDYIFFPNDDKVTYINNGIPGWINLKDLSLHEYPNLKVIKPFVNGVAIISKANIEIRCISTYTYNGLIYPEHNIYGELKFDYLSSDHQEGLINEYGQILVEPNFTEIKRIHNIEDFFAAKLNGKWGALNTNGEVFIPFEYDWFNDELWYDDDHESVISFGNDSKVSIYDYNWNIIAVLSQKEFLREHSDYDYRARFDYEQGTY